MVNIIANTIGALGAIVFIGYFSYRVAEPPLIIITVVCMALMVYSFYDDMRRDQAVARIRSENENGN